MFLKKELTAYNRYQAFTTHMAISLVVFFILLACITQYWYPGILFDTGNGWKAIGLIVGIDLILGPLLTLLVFNHNKKTLKMDLWIIALLQIAALIYGAWTIHSSRPLAIAYVNTSFITFYANAGNADEIQRRIDTLKTRQLFYVFNDENPTSSLEAKQLAPYANYANTIPTLVSPYHTVSAQKDALLIQIDPLLSAHRFLSVDNQSGKITGFSNQRTGAAP